MEPDFRTLDWIRRTTEQMIEAAPGHGGEPASISEAEIDALIRGVNA